jgi:hypothetical protein
MQKKHFYYDLSFWALAASNLIVLLWARRQNLPLAAMLWVYWGQGVGIGIFSIIKILLIKNYYPATEKKSGKTRAVTTKDKVLFAVMFFLFYGLLHQAYARYLSDEFEFIAFGPVFWMAVVLLISHLFSFFLQQEMARQRQGHYRRSVHISICPHYPDVPYGLFWRPPVRRV